MLTHKENGSRHFSECDRRIKSFGGKDEETKDNTETRQSGRGRFHPLGGVQKENKLYRMTEGGQSFLNDLLFAGRSLSTAYYGPIKTVCNN